MSGEYVKVWIVPCAYNHGAEAKRDDPESAPLLWFWHPHLWGVARGSGIGRRIRHLFLWIGEDDRSSRVKSVGFYLATREQPLICGGVVCHFIFGMGRCHYAGNDFGYFPKPSLRVHGNGPFPARLFLDLD